MAKRTPLRAVLAFAFAALTSPAESAAIDFERLMMPGPVSQAHAETEDECSKCHSPFDTGREAALCIHCHEEVGADRDSFEGFHGRDRGATGLACRSCHSEHKGREHDITGLDPIGFNHDATDHRLLGAHRAAACEACHPADGKSKRRDTAHDCHSCHESQDRHRGKLGDKCGDCHDEEAWSNGKFDHAKTDYPLSGKHVDAPCGRCHPNQKYKDAPTKCIDCHRIDDQHEGRLGDDCAVCHTPKSFKDSASFDHAKETKFPLEGRHAKITCEACHIKPAKDVKLPTACGDCHKIVDAHRGLLGDKCEDCHRSDKWKTTIFDHNESSRFELRGGHLEVKCADCHRTTPNRDGPLPTCRSCHAKDDVHRGQLGETCARCHNEKSWTGQVFFEHDLTRFPLLGLHATMSCESCHESSRFRDAKIGCVDCHAKDDTHKRGLGTQCGLCHNPNAWNIWAFDHNTQTKFPLEGGHEGLACAACHTGASRDKVRASKDCYGCHSRDDAHHGRFGRNCKGCHGVDSWKNVKIMR